MYRVEFGLSKTSHEIYLKYCHSWQRMEIIYSITTETGGVRDLVGLDQFLATSM